MSDFGLDFRLLGRMTIKKIIRTSVLNFLNLVHSGYISECSCSQLKWVQVFRGEDAYITPKKFHRNIMSGVCTHTRAHTHPTRTYLAKY